MTNQDIDRDLVDSPPTRVISAGYARLFDAHVAQSVEDFARALPRRGLLSLFSRKGSWDAAKLRRDFEVAYRSLLTDHTIRLFDSESPDQDPYGTVLQPVLVFVSTSRDLVVPDRFLNPIRRINGSDDDADTMASCFPFDLIAAIDRVLSGASLSAEQRKKVCEAASFDIAMSFDDGVLDERFDGEAVAPILCYSAEDQALVLLPASAAQHEYVHGSLDHYFSSRSN